MKKAKKLSVVVLTLLLSLSLTTGALASNGKGKGLETAPGQSANFSNGITTLVTTSEIVTEDLRVDRETSEESSTETKSSTSEELVVVDTKVEKEFHPAQNWFRYVTTTTTQKTTIQSSWDETTTITTTTTTETPLTITETTETTITHRGAPGSNGKVLSETSLTTKDVVEGVMEVVDIQTSEKVTKGDTTTEVINVTLLTNESKGDWNK
ncbi:hypothetical protein H1D32_21380 [Anaerobacillus sp. CMMVII]|uniref:hypothetical protein n=1 Tax=Anaerobacillus sp. CMMVII TaxID=2755588 RepID=UPI0021B75531|nr:hypothetical protein [Anaerobacillus sp. CMMVII]MCT8140012.1 hypothetical protein [Anaerobacillus sp. CMMVII]